MANQTLSARGLRQIWTRLPPPIRRRLIGQLVFLLRPIDLGVMSEPIRHPARPPQPYRRGVRSAIAPAPDGTPPGEPVWQYQLADRARCFGWPAHRCLVIDDDLRISGRAEQQQTRLSAASFDARAPRSGNRLGARGLAVSSKLPGLVSAAEASSGVERAHRG
jgi:hypothetical protein